MITKIKIDGMSCNHCVMAITNALKEIDTVESVSVSLEEKTATITSKSDVSLDKIKELIEEEGFTFSGII
ncbi:MAG: heavy-metal-associated domain-containing protein [Fusobacteriaceae bacterium]|nr:heavy-metal-associated domain-containing protein [Fusobacteriaceae bacterium]MBN2839287.1 heavy-metal-associated domain-containing protein [Fusobacteriaceae bacterium]